MFRNKINKLIILNNKLTNSKFINRNFNITSSIHIEKIGKHLLTDDDQTVILNLPFEKDYLLTKYLIDNNQKNQILLINKSLSEFNFKNNLNINIIDKVNLLKLEPHHTISKESDIKIYNLITDKLIKKEWIDKPTAKLFMIVPYNGKKILRSFIGQIKTFSNLFCNGRIELYLLLTDIEFNKIKLNSTSQIFFTFSYKFLYDYKLLDQFQWSDLNLTRCKSLFNMNKDCYFVRLTPKKSLTIDYSKDYLNYFINFLGRLNVRKNTLMIAFFEVWFPEIGLKLIDLNYSVFTKFGDLKLDDYLKIYELLMKEERDAFIEILNHSNNN